MVGGGNARQSVETPHERLRRLSKRVADGVVVPFVGAGVSNQARVVGEPSFDPTVHAMKDRLAEVLEPETNPASAAYPLTAGLLATGTCPKTPPCDRVRRLVCKNTLGRLAEVAGWLRGDSAVYEYIQLDRLVKLRPRAAHRYIAYLAREGLFPEILTTNYDTCIEKAFVESFAPAERIPDPCGVDPEARDGSTALAPMVVVTTLEDYRQTGARSFTADRRHPVSRLIKLNGCAVRGKPGPGTALEGRDGPSSIILTEQQLLSFRGERWKEDLLRDRARLRTLLFTGFGSDEPQIRHTILTLIAEFRSGRNGRAPRAGPARTPEDMADLPNAPFIAGYEESLSFNQVELLQAYWAAHAEEAGADPAPLADGGAREVSKGKIQQHVARTLDSDCASFLRRQSFTGADAAMLCHKRARHTSTTTLPADLFWRCLFEAVWARLLARHTQRGSPFDQWIREAGLAAPARWRRGLLGWLGISSDGDLVEEQSNQGRQRLLALLACGRPMLLSRWIRSLVGIRPASTAKNPPDFYLPLNQNALLIAGTLLVVSRRVPPIECPIWSCVRQGPVGGLTLEGARVTLVSGAGAGDRRTATVISAACRRRIALRMTRRDDVFRLVEEIPDTSNGVRRRRIRMIRGRIVPAAWLLARLGPPGREGDQVADLQVHVRRAFAAWTPPRRASLKRLEQRRRGRGV